MYAYIPIISYSRQFLVNHISNWVDSRVRDLMNGSDLLKIILRTFTFVHTQCCPISSPLLPLVRLPSTSTLHFSHIGQPLAVTGVWFLLPIPLILLSLFVQINYSLNSLNKYWHKIKNKVEDLIN